VIGFDLRHIKGAIFGTESGGVDEQAARIYTNTK
jgi:hypothetical protein